MSADLEVRAANMAELDQLDPVARELAVTGMLDQCRTWLATAVEATEPKRISEFKAFVATIAETTKQLNLSKDIQLDATEMVRRAERGVGVAIRKGQEVGDIRGIGSDTRTDLPDRVGGGNSVSPTEYASKYELTSTHGGIYDVTDGVSDEAFEEAIAEAKEEGNLARANVVRKIKDEKSPTDRRKKLAELAEKGYSSRQIAKMAGYSNGDTVRETARDMGIKIPADKIIGKSRKIDSNRIVSEMVISLEAMATTVLDLVDPDQLDQEQLEYWVNSLSSSLRSLNRFRNQLKEFTRD